MRLLIFILNAPVQLESGDCTCILNSLLREFPLLWRPCRKGFPKVVDWLEVHLFVRIDVLGICNGCCMVQSQRAGSSFEVGTVRVGLREKRLYGKT